MKEFNKEKEYKKIRNPKINIVILSISLFLLVILSTFIYKSFALFKINSEHIIIDGVIGNFFSDKEFSYIGEVQEFIVPVSAYYKIELWGAQGSLAIGGLGGYTSGIIYLNENEKLYIYVGQDSQVSNVPGWNGGGYSSIAQSPRGAGGGATDVRLEIASQTDNTVWNESTSLRSRIMVVGAGGGGITDVYNVNGGVGGNLIGGMGVKTGPDVSVTLNSGGSQTSGGIGGNGAVFNGVAGFFGQGGYPNSLWTAGGGGGYYGGGSSSLSSSTVVSGAGGSSYISGYAGVNSVQESGGTSSQPLHTNNTLHYSGRYFLNGKMESGVNTGNGKAKIIYVGPTIPARTNTKLDNVRYIKACNSGDGTVNIAPSSSWVEIQAIKDGINIAKGKTVIGTVAQYVNSPYTAIVDGSITAGGYGGAGAVGLQCVTIDLGQSYNLDEVGLWGYYLNSRIYYQNTLSVGEINVSGTTSLSTILHTYSGTAGYPETSQGKRYTAWD